jgi:hypothetical protein
MLYKIQEAPLTIFVLLAVGGFPVSRGFPSYSALSEMMSHDLSPSHKYRQVMVVVVVTDLK